MCSESQKFPIEDHLAAIHPGTFDRERYDGRSTWSGRQVLDLVGRLSKNDRVGTVEDLRAPGDEGIRLPGFVSSLHFSRNVGGQQQALDARSVVGRAQQVRQLRGSSLDAFRGVTWFVFAIRCSCHFFCGACFVTVSTRPTKDSQPRGKDWKMNIS